MFFKLSVPKKKRKVRKLLVSHIFENEDKAVVLMFKLALQSYSCFQLNKIWSEIYFRNALLNINYETAVIGEIHSFSVFVNIKYSDHSCLYT